MLYNILIVLTVIISLLSLILIYKLCVNTCVWHSWRYNGPNKYCKICNKHG